MQARSQDSKALPQGFIDPPSTAASLKQWQEFLDGMEKWPQDNQVTKREVEFARKVVAWKQGGEKGEAPKRETPPLPTEALRQAEVDHQTGRKPA